MSKLNKCVFPLLVWGKPHGSTHQTASARWQVCPPLKSPGRAGAVRPEGQGHTYLLGGKNSIELLWWCQEGFSKGDLTSGDFDTNRSGLGVWRSRLSLWKRQWKSSVKNNGETSIDMASRGRTAIHSHKLFSPPRLLIPEGWRECVCMDVSGSSTLTSTQSILHCTDKRATGLKTKC